jgi:hypothetical protein
VAQAARAIVVTNRPHAVSVDARDGLPSPGIVEASFFPPSLLQRADQMIE